MVSLFQHPTFDSTTLAGKFVLDVGCGQRKLPGAVGVDHRAYPGVDIVADLNGPLPFKEATFDAVYSNQVLEHIPNLIGLVEEIHRVLRQGGIMVAHVPYFRSSWAAIDPTHVRQFTLNSLHYFVRGTLEHESHRFSDVTFSSVERYLDWEYPPTPFRLLFASLARRWPYRAENSFLSFLHPFESLTFVLTK